MWIFSSYFPKSYQSYRTAQAKQKEHEESRDKELKAAQDELSDLEKKLAESESQSSYTWPKWVIGSSDEGHTYYYNTVTQGTVTCRRLNQCKC